MVMCCCCALISSAYVNVLLEGRHVMPSAFYL
jgi:hypothetical protein